MTTAFESIPVSTRTFTADTNICINLDKLFDMVEITPYIVVQKRRGRKRRTVQEDPNEHVPYGSIITAKYENKIKGVDTKKTTSGHKKWFRNSVTFVIILDKPVNFKVCRNGTLQMTGCKTYKHAEQCVEALWNIVSATPDVYRMKNESDIPKALIIPSMRNIDFSLGFTVDREKLNQYMIYNKDTHCLLETSFGYTGVNIKFPLTHDMSTMMTRRMTFEGDKWNACDSTYREYLDGLPPKIRDIKLRAKRYNTFLVFHSGKVIMSGMSTEFMSDAYSDFNKMIANAKNEIEEKLF